MATKIAGLKVLAAMTCVGMLAACANQQEEAAPPPPPPEPVEAPTMDTGTVDQSEMNLPAAGSIESLIAEVGTDRVFFAFDSSELTAESRETLRKGADWLRANDAVSLTIEGHCDERGTREYNLALGERRANAVRNYLIALGVSGSRLNTISYGKERPAVLGSTESAWAKNRRAVATIASDSAY
ncbi:MAG: peptidoglycan-associated lipoprotein Pal [Sphingomonadales bacterium]|jgi:peptidoglycan-associated lipoprotein